MRISFIDSIQEIICFLSLTCNLKFIMVNRIKLQNVFKILMSDLSFDFWFCRDMLTNELHIGEIFYWLSAVSDNRVNTLKLWTLISLQPFYHWWKVWFMRNILASILDWIVSLIKHPNIHIKNSRSLCLLDWVIMNVRRLKICLINLLWTHLGNRRVHYFIGLLHFFKQIDSSNSFFLISGVMSLVFQVNFRRNVEINWLFDSKWWLMSNQ